MATSRYRKLTVIDGAYYETSDFPSTEDLSKIPTFTIMPAKAERLDILAFKHLGAGEYWWIIALMNNLDWPYNMPEGKLLKIPTNVQDVLRFF